MAVVNRCAIAVAPRQPMRDWSRPFWTREDMEGLNDEHSLYLIPTYESEAEAQQRLRERFAAIFEAELDLWCRDRMLWPEPRPFELFEQWFSVRFFPLVEDLAGEELLSYELDESFNDSVRTALN
jgi:hypothetical protein